MTTTTPSPRRIVSGTDLLRLSGAGLRTRKLRAALSALGIAIGVAAIVAVLGLSQTSESGLISELDSLGTNLLTVTNGTDIAGNNTELPIQAPALVSQIAGVTDVQDTATVSNVNVYRNQYINPVNTGSLSVLAATPGLLSATGGSLAQGKFLNAVTVKEPVAVLGALAAQRLGIDRIFTGQRILVDNQWFYVAGILNPITYASNIDTSVLVGFPAAQTYLGSDGHPSTVYVRTKPDQVTTVQALLANAADPENANEVNVSLPSDILTAKAAAQGALNTLFLGLGAVVLLVGSIGVANIMIISVMERRQEIGLRRALGATKGHIRVQFLSEAIVLALSGGVVGVGAGALVTAIYGHVKGDSVVIPPEAWAGGLGAAIAIGALAGLLPALRAARMSPTQALWAI